jgi:hypothetical protein
MRGNVIEALDDAVAEACIMSEFLTDTFLGNMPLVLTDRLFKSPSGLIFECRGIARAMPIEIEKIKVQLDFHIYPILDFDLLVGYPLEKLLQEGASQGSFKDELQKSAFATSTFSLETPIAKPHPKSNPLEEVMLELPFVSSKPISHLHKTERPSSPSIEFLSLLPLAQSFMMNPLEKDDLCAMDIPEAMTLEYESFSFEESCLHKESSKSASLSTTCSYGDDNHRS